MPRLTKSQTRSKRACEAKAVCQNINHNINVPNSKDDDNIDDNLKDTVFFDDELEGYDDIDNLPVYDEPVENDNAVSIVRKLQEAAKKYYQESHKVYRSYYIGNSIRNKRRKNQQQ